MEFLKFDEKTGRLKYFFNIIMLWVVELVLFIMFAMFTAATTPQGGGASSLEPSVILFILVMAAVSIYLWFITTAKRFWDLTGNRGSGVHLTVAFFVASLIPFINLVVGLVAFIYLFFIPGKEALEVKE